MRPQLHEKFLQFDWLGGVVFQLNLKYLHVKIKHDLYVIIGINTTREISKLSQIITFNDFEIPVVVFMPNITTNHALTDTNTNVKIARLVVLLSKTIMFRLKVKKLKSTH